MKYFSLPGAFLFFACALNNANVANYVVNATNGSVYLQYSNYIFAGVIDRLSLLMVYKTKHVESFISQKEGTQLPIIHGAGAAQVSDEEKESEKEGTQLPIIHGAGAAQVSDEEKESGVRSTSEMIAAIIGWQNQLRKFRKELQGFAESAGIRPFAEQLKNLRDEVDTTLKKIHDATGRR